MYVHGPQIGYRVRSSLYDGGSLCQGFFMGYALHLAALSLIPRAGACRGSFANDILAATTDELDLEIRIAHAWDLPWLTFDLGWARVRRFSGRRSRPAGWRRVGAAPRVTSRRASA